MSQSGRMYSVDKNVRKNRNKQSKNIRKKHCILILKFFDPTVDLYLSMLKY
jgi:hypothetical protein